jgi:hypothetical protein
MNMYSALICLHAVVAVAGVGLVGTVPLLARMQVDSDAKTALLERLLRITRISLALMVVTGVLLDFTAGGAYHTALWFRVSFGLMVLTFFSHARARASLRKGATAGIERWGWAMCGAVVSIVVLMEAKPFQ